MQTVKAGKKLGKVVNRSPVRKPCQLNDGEIFIIQNFTQLTHGQYHDQSRHKHGLLQPSWSGTPLLFPSCFLFLFYVCCRDATLSRSVAKKNINPMPGTHCLYN